MKKFNLFLLPLCATALLFAGCEKDNGTQDDDNSNVNSVGTFTQAAVIDAVADMYAAWEADATIPQSMKVGDADLTLPQYQYAMAKVMVDLRNGSTADVEVINCKAADHPDRDSYDAEEIAVFNGPANGEETEDLANIAARIIDEVNSDGQIPNQTLFTRDGEAIAYSTDRATVTFARAISAYKEDGKMPATVTTNYLSAVTKVDIGEFAKQYVKILDIWEETTGIVNSVTGVGPTTDEEYAEFDVEDAHYVPLETTITVGEKQFGTADIFEIAIRSYLLLRGYDGNSTTAGNGTFEAITPATMSSDLPETHGYQWGPMPFNETGSYTAPGNYISNGGELRMEVADNPDGVEMVKTDLLDNFAQRNANFPINNGLLISNMSGYSDSQVPGYHGCCSAQRALITYAHFFKYLLDNDLEDASSISADQTFESHLFN